MKKRKIEFYGEISSTGELVPYKEPIGKMLSSFFSDNPEKKFKATYKIIADMKSYAQLKFYFGVLIPSFVMATGETDRNLIDHYLREKYLARWEQLKYASSVKNTLHIPTLQIDANEIDKVEMSGFISNCLNELWDMGGSVPQEEIDNLYSIMSDDIEGQQLIFK